jgi:hypothetical protein
MAKRVRVGARYRVMHYIPMWGNGPAVGSIVTIVNPPGGATGGVVRHVQDDAGNIYLIPISALVHVGTYNKHLGRF